MTGGQPGVGMPGKTKILTVDSLADLTKIAIKKKRTE